MTKIRSLLLVVLFACSFVASAKPKEKAKVVTETVHERWTRDPQFHLYSVVFGITIDAKSKIDQFRVAKVVDPGSETTAPSDVKVPKKYIEAAKKKLSGMRYQPNMKEGKAVEFFTYMFYSPEYPDIAISDLNKPLDKQ